MAAPMDEPTSEGIDISAQLSRSKDPCYNNNSVSSSKSKGTKQMIINKNCAMNSKIHQAKHLFHLKPHILGRYTLGVTRCYKTRAIWDMNPITLLCSDSVSHGGKSICCPECLKEKMTRNVKHIIYYCTNCTLSESPFCLHYLE